MGCAGSRPIIRPPEDSTLSDWADWLAEFIAVLDLGPAHVAGLSWGGGLALDLYRRHPEAVRTLILVSAYAGWAGSLPADVVEQRLQVMLRNSELPPKLWAPALINTLISASHRGAPRPGMGENEVPPGDVGFTVVPESPNISLT